MQYNEENGIVPTTIKKDVRDIIKISGRKKSNKTKEKDLNKKEKEKLIKELKAAMKEASKMLEFEYAIQLRDRIKELEK